MTSAWGQEIEAGLVLQELLLRNQIELVEIIAPASLCPQWEREMAMRFGTSSSARGRGPTSSPTSTTTRAGDDEQGSMHAKCVVVDEAATFITSANFTSAAQTTNVEVECWSGTLNSPRESARSGAAWLRKACFNG
jgi:phosphatidylserine/phosphatidylglycerophosphate/cardiolipin synthase-like enzyme